MEESSAELLERARQGDDRALERLLERHQAQVYRYGLSMCRDPEDAKDVLQDTLLAMARGVRDFRGESSISTWLYTVARSFCIKKRRKSKFAPDHERSLETSAAEDGMQLVDDARGPEDALAGKQVEEALGRAIESLEPMYREVLVLRDVEGLKATEVAEVLGITVQAVKSRLHRARLAVREQLAPLLGVPTEAKAKEGTCPDVLSLYSQHVEDEISAELCADMERHIEECAKCRNACDSLKRSLALCRTAGPSVKVPPAVQASVRGALRDFLSVSGATP
jgi:RNA polymerase sigma-70 factor, ECF subfamily